jgi:hypothetical protein
MTKVQATAAGRVLRISVGKTDNGKDVLSAWIELVPRVWNGKRFNQRLEARTFWDVPEISKIQRKGDWLTISGEADAETFKTDSGVHAKLVITGRMTRLDMLPPEATPEPQAA